MSHTRSDEDFRRWLFEPLSSAERLRIERAEYAYVVALAEWEARLAEVRRIRADLGRPRPSFAELAERRGDLAKAAAARAHERRIFAAPMPAGYPALLDEPDAPRPVGRPSTSAMIRAIA